MSETECDECGSTFDCHDWHPAMLADDDEAMFEFCSQDCKAAFRERSRTVTDSPTQ